MADIAFEIDRPQYDVEKLTSGKNAIMFFYDAEELYEERMFFYCLGLGRA
jgi:hypothetical protein